MIVAGSSPTFYDLSGDLRDALAKVEKQMATGRVASNFGELGAQSQTWLDFSQTASEANAYSASINQQTLRLKLIDNTLGSAAKTIGATRSLLSGGTEALSNGGATAQNSFAMLADLLNSKNGNVPLFGGGALSGDAILSAQAMMEGDSTQPGLRSLIKERIQAETGGNDLGRLGLAGSASSLTLTQNGGAFGYRILGVTSSNATVSSTGSAGPPPASVVTASGPLANGETITVRLGLPDGSEQSLTLTVGADGIAAGNFDGSTMAAALRGKLAELTPVLKSSAALKVAQDYFAGTMSRVSGTPTAAATSTAAAAPVTWYLGTVTSDPRASSGVQIGENERLKVGLQANESVFAKSLAGMAAVAVLLDDPAMRTRQGQGAMSQTLGATMPDNGFASVQVEFGLISKQLDDGKAVQDGIKKIAENFLSTSNRADPTQMSAQLLTLQNYLQASYQAGARILKLTLTDYL